MPLKIITPPAAPPIDVAEARLHVRQDITDDDTKLAVLIRAARESAETETQRAIVSTRFVQILDAFPSYAIRIERSPLIQVVSVQYLDMAGTWQTMPSTDTAIDDAGTLPLIAPVFGKIWPITLPQIGAVRITYDAGWCAPLTADVAANTITVRGWMPLAVGDALRLSNSGGALPAPLQPDTDYYVQAVPSAGVYTLAATAGGAVIDLTSAGTGLHFIGCVPEALKSWMLVRIDSLYNNRGENASVNGSFAPAPYIDRLLDPFRALTA